MRHRTTLQALALVTLAPLFAGCAGGGGNFLGSDLLSRDAEWFSGPSRLFIKNISVDTPPLTPDKPVQQADLITSDGGCAGSPVQANASADPAAPIGAVALGHVECDVARALGAPDNVALSNNERGDRVATMTYVRGPRAGIYTFTGGRLSMVERGASPPPEPKPARVAKKKRAAG